MAEPFIHVIPEEYWGGKAPTKPPPKQVAPAETLTPAPASSAAVSLKRSAAAPSKRKAKPKTLFFIIAGVLFVGVVGGATWYFTRPLRRAPHPGSSSPSAPTPPAQPSPPPAPPKAPELPQPAVEPAVPPQPPPPPSPTNDTDSDGLTDAEEEIYRSKPTVPDTDNDGYLDGHEVFNLYNPSGIAPQRLEAAGLALEHNNDKFGYAILYPALWQVVPQDEAGRAILFAAQAQEGVTVTAVENLGKLSLRDWISQQNPDETAALWSTNKAGLEGYVSSSAKGLTFYFALDARVFLIRYDPQGGAGSYKRTAEMMANSFKPL